MECALIALAEQHDASWFDAHGDLSARRYRFHREAAGDEALTVPGDVDLAEVALEDGFPQARLQNISCRGGPLCGDLHGGGAYRHDQVRPHGAPVGAAIDDVSVRRFQ